MKRRIPWLHLILFLLTFFSTLAVGALQTGANIFADPLLIVKGLPFSVTILSILLAHEFSHYAASKRHRVSATLPYFIPAPTIFGTMGAVIKMKSPILTRDALVDIGASGPIAGFVVAVVASVIGLSLSDVVALKDTTEGYLLGDSLLFRLLSLMVLGSIPEHADVLLHPVAFAGWIGFFVTALNLIPVGQLDGGHIAYALIGERHTAVSKVLVALLAVMGIFLWPGWLVWAALMLFLGFRHPPIIHAHLPLDPLRRRIGITSLIIFILTFTPVPIQIIGQ